MFIAEEVAKNPNIYYGAKVTNYSVGGIEEWKLFHLDGENIYLISSDYIPVDKIPKTKSGNKLENMNPIFSKTAPLTNAVSDILYAKGSEAIKSYNLARKWIASYLDNYSSNLGNMKAVAYMLDTSVWNAFKSDKAKYAIGGPTLDMLFASYNNKYKTNYQAKAESYVGYQISNGNGKECWLNYLDDILNTADKLYVLPISNGALSFWIASPSACCIDNMVMCLNYDGYVSFNHCGNVNIGF